LASQVAAAVSAQGLTRHMVDRVLGETSIASPRMNPFAKGEAVIDTTLLGIKEMIEKTGAARAVVLTIDEGRLWWSTRLFLLASLLRSLTGVRQLVFCDTDGGFVGMASPSAIFDALADAFPLVGEFARKLSLQPSSSDIDVETDRQTSEWNLYVQSLPLEKLPAPVLPAENERSHKGRGSSTTS
jgi:hypothetical protein